MWSSSFNPDDYKRPIKLSHDLIDAKNKKKVLQKGEKLNIIIARKLQEKNLKEILISNSELEGKYVKKDIKDKEGSVIIESGHNFKR